MDRPGYCAATRLTSSGNVFAANSSTPILIFGYGVESGATAAQPYFNNGSALAGSSIVLRPGPVTVSQGNVNSFPVAIIFNNGCYVSFDANTTAVTVFYQLR